MKYRFKTIQYGVRAFAFPFLLIAYLFYFFNWRIFGLMRQASIDTEYWESRVLIWAGMICLIAFNIAWLPFSLVLLTGIWGWYFLFFATWIPMVFNICAMDYSDPADEWKLIDIVNLIFPPRPAKQAIPNPYEKDPDYQEALKELGGI